MQKTDEGYVVLGKYFYSYANLESNVGGTQVFKGKVLRDEVEQGPDSFREDVSIIIVDCLSGEPAVVQ